MKNDPFMFFGFILTVAILYSTSIVMPLLVIVIGAAFFYSIAVLIDMPRRMTKRYINDPD